MMRGLAFVAVLLLMLAAVGCGTASETASEPSASPTTVTASPSPEPPTEADIFGAYLVRCKKVRAKYDKIMDRCQKLEGKKLNREAKKLYKSETAWALITPPAGLEKAHAAYGLSIRYNREAYQYWAYGDFAGSNKYSDRASQQFDKYHLALTVMAKKLGVKIPWKWDLG